MSLNYRYVCRLCWLLFKLSVFLQSVAMKSVILRVSILSALILSNFVSLFNDWSRDYSFNICCWYVSTLGLEWFLWLWQVTCLYHECPDLSNFVILFNDSSRNYSFNICCWCVGTLGVGVYGCGKYVILCVSILSALILRNFVILFIDSSRDYSFNICCWSVSVL